MTRAGIEPRSPGSLPNTQLIWSNLNTINWVFKQVGNHQKICSKIEGNGF